MHPHTFMAWDIGQRPERGQRQAMDHRPEARGEGREARLPWPIGKRPEAMGHTPQLMGCRL